MKKTPESLERTQGILAQRIEKLTDINKRSKQVKKEFEQEVEKLEDVIDYNKIPTVEVKETPDDWLHGDEYVSHCRKGKYYLVSSDPTFHPAEVKVGMGNILDFVDKDGSIKRPEQSAIFLIGKDERELLEYLSSNPYLIGRFAKDNIG